MQRVYFLGIINEVSEVRFDFYNKLKESFYIKIFDKDNKDIFTIKISGKFCEYVYRKVKMSDLVYAICNVSIHNRKIIYRLEDIEIL